MDRVALVLLMVISAALLGMALPDILTYANEARTNSASQAFACTTGVGQTSCALTLTSAHAFPSTSGMTVQQTAPSSVDVTASSSLSEDRLTVTVAGLLASTSYSFTVTYLAADADVSTGLSLFMGQFALLFGALALVLFAVAMVAIWMSRPAATSPG